VVFDDGHPLDLLPAHPVQDLVHVRVDVNRERPGMPAEGPTVFRDR
jgi:hypothetical protein